MHRSTVTTTAATVGLAAVAALAVAAPAIAEVVRASGEVDRYDHAGAPQPPLATAPAGATARVQSVETGDGRTIVTLDVSGFDAFAEYGAHAHVAPCGGTAGQAAGPHYQDDVDPVALSTGKPSVDPAYANPDNEVWLDFTTNRTGGGRAKAVVDWRFRDIEGTRSVIIHERRTSTLADPGPSHGAPGSAGKRVACLNVDF